MRANEQVLKSLDNRLVNHYTIHIKVDDVKGDTPEEFADAVDKYLSNLVRIAKEYKHKKKPKHNNIKAPNDIKKLEEYIPFDMDIYY